MQLYVTSICGHYQLILIIKTNLTKLRIIKLFVQLVKDGTEKIRFFGVGIGSVYFKINKILVERGKTLMRDFTTYLSTAPVAAILSLTVVAGVLIEINRFFPDALIFAF